MRTLIAWTRTNPIIVISVVVAIAAIGFLFFISTQGAKLDSQVQDQSNTIQTIQSFLHQSVQVPPEKPDQPPRQLINVVITKQAIDDLKKKYQQMSQQHDRLFDFAVQLNQRHHQPLEDNLFPSTDQAKIRFDARNAYRQAFRQMLKAPAPKARYPRLNAGMPVSPYRLKQVVARIDAQIKNENFNMHNQSGSTAAHSNRGTNLQLTAADIRTIRQRKQIALIATVRARAKSIAIYADTKAALNDPNCPYDVDAWSDTGNKPTMPQLWEAQLELWIQQDVTAAIVMANRSVNPKNDELHNPIKRLIQMNVVPGYIGLQTRGAVPIGMSEDAVRKKAMSVRNNGTAIDFFGGPGAGRRQNVDSVGGQRSLEAFLGRRNGYGSQSAKNGQRRDGTYPPPAGGQRTNDVNKPVPLNFYVSPTGRVSNALFDVRQVKVSLILDYRHLPALFNALARVNFMTVITCNIHDVNAHAALVAGYDYGSGSIVRADMIIETLWLRNWTAKLMPKPVRQYVGLTAPPPPPEKTTKSSEKKKTTGKSESQTSGKMF